MNSSKGILRLSTRAGSVIFVQFVHSAFVLSLIVHSHLNLPSLSVICL